MKSLQLLSPFMQYIHREIEEEFPKYLKQKNISDLPTGVRNKYGFSIDIHGASNRKVKKDNQEQIIPINIGSMVTEKLGPYIKTQVSQYNPKKLYEYWIKANEADQFSISIPYLMIYIRFLDYSDLKDFVNSIEEISEELRLKQISLIEKAQPNRAGNELLTVYDAYGYSLHRRDIFYYFIKIISKTNAKKINENEYNIRLYTYTKEGNFEEDYSGLLIERSNYAYFHFFIKNNKGQVKREFYIIAYLGDKSILTASVIYSTYIVTSRNMHLSSGFLVMKRGKNRSESLNVLPMVMRRYFNLHKPQIRLHCETPMDYDEIPFDNDPQGILGQLIGTYALVVKSPENSNYDICKLEICDDYKCFIVEKDDVSTLCNIALKASNIYISTQTNAFVNVTNSYILKIYGPDLLMGNSLGISIQGNPESGKVAAIKIPLSVNIDSMQLVDLKQLLVENNQMEAYNFLVQ